MEFNDSTYGVVEHEKAGSFFYKVRRFIYVYQIEDRSQNFVHTLYILNLRIKSRVNIQDTSHVVIPISFSLLFFVFQKLFVTQLVLSVNHFKLFPPGARQVRYHDLLALSCEEREFSMCPRSIFFDLLPKK